MAEKEDAKIVSVTTEKEDSWVGDTKATVVLDDGTVAVGRGTGEGQAIAVATNRSKGKYW